MTLPREAVTLRKYIARLRKKLGRALTLRSLPDARRRDGSPVDLNGVEADRKAYTWALDHIERTFQLAFEDPFQAAIEQGALKPVWCHIAGGGAAYTELARGKLQISDPSLQGCAVVVYRGNRDGRIWVQPESEFMSGAFELMSPRTTEQLLELEEN